MTPQCPLWLLSTRTGRTRTSTRRTLPRTTTPCIPLSTAQTTPGALLSNVSQVLSFGTLRVMLPIQLYNLAMPPTLSPSSSSSSCNPRKVHHAPPLCPLRTRRSSHPSSAQSAFRWTACSCGHPQHGGTFRFFFVCFNVNLLSICLFLNSLHGS